MSKNTKLRVKVYELSSDSNWSDLGTGYCSFENSDDNYRIKVVSEDDDLVFILDNELLMEEKYTKEQSSLIVWTEPGDKDMAISFQEADSCLEIWNKIRKVQFEHGYGDFYGTDCENNDSEKSDDSPCLPNPTVGNLVDIEEILEQSGYYNSRKDQIINYIISENYIDKLVSVLDTCESLDDFEDAFKLFKIVKQIVLYNDSAIFEYIIKNERFHGFIGIMEYDPDFPSARGKYREFISNQLNFREILPIGDKEIENKVHEVFRLQYLKDVVLARIIDETSNSIIGSLILFYNSEILTYIESNNEFQKNMFSISSDPNESEERKNEVVLFMKQYSQMYKSLPNSYRGDSFKTLCDNGLFEVLRYSLNSENSKTQLSGLELLIFILDCDKQLVREYLLTDDESKDVHPSLLFKISEIINSDSETDVQILCVDILRILLDTSSMNSESFGTFIEISHKNSQNQSSLKLVSEELDQQNKKQSLHAKNPPKGGVRVWSTRVIDDDEEAYFDASDDENDDELINNNSNDDMDNISSMSDHGPQVVISLSKNADNSRSKFPKTSTHESNNKSEIVPVSNNNFDIGDDIFSYSNNSNNQNKSPDLNHLSMSEISKCDSTDSDSSSDEGSSAEKQKIHVDTPIVSRGLSFMDRTNESQNNFSNLSDNNSPTPSPLSSPTFSKATLDDDLDDKLECLLTKNNKRNLDSSAGSSDSSLSIHDSENSIDSSSSEDDAKENLSKKSKVYYGNSDANHKKQSYTINGAEIGRSESISFSFKKKISSPKKLIFDFKGNKKNIGAQHSKLIRSNSGSISSEIPKTNSLNSGSLTDPFDEDDEKEVDSSSEFSDR
ncbi:hypothetical protein AYI69_g4000 [Smittium culicis]|uniref:Uncharacterized protein n=1 Tax=Smittium culicis TaxID=133412 RepID=A0A1R1YHI8_9FUNG|nr:hypothetical protein AYI69_g4000 [Smittium culicis]